MDDIFVKLKEPATEFGDFDYLIYMDEILHTHKWLDCECCSEMRVIKKGYSFVRVMKKLGWIYKPCLKKSRKKWQQKIWQCPECQKKISLDEFLSKKEMLSDVVRLREIRYLTDEEENEHVSLLSELAKCDPCLFALNEFRVFVGNSKKYEDT